MAPRASREVSGGVHSCGGTEAPLPAAVDRIADYRLASRWESSASLAPFVGQHATFIRPFSQSLDRTTTAMPHKHPHTASIAPAWSEPPRQRPLAQSPEERRRQIQRRSRTASALGHY